MRRPPKWRPFRATLAIRLVWQAYHTHLMAVHSAAMRAVGLRADAQESAAQDLRALYGTTAAHVPVRDLRRLERAAQSITEGVDTSLRHVPRIRGHEVLPGGVTAVEKTIGAWRALNVSLIRTVGADHLGAVEKVLADHPNAHTAELTRLFQERLGVAKWRAKFWARDQALQLNAQIQEERQRSLGVVEYIWHAQKDEHTRPTHRDLDGTHQRWDNPPVTEENGATGSPGRRWQCRCYAEPVLPGAETLGTVVEAPAPKPGRAPKEPPEWFVRQGNQPNGPHGIQIPRPPGRDLTHISVRHRNYRVVLPTGDFRDFPNLRAARKQFPGGSVVELGTGRTLAPAVAAEPGLPVPARGSAGEAARWAFGGYESAADIMRAVQAIPLNDTRSAEVQEMLGAITRKAGLHERPLQYRSPMFYEWKQKGLAVGNYGVAAVEGLPAKGSIEWSGGINIRKEIAQAVQSSPAPSEALYAKVKETRIKFPRTEAEREWLKSHEARQIDKWGDTVNTAIHEELHACSPCRHAAYSGTAMKLEEGLVDTMAGEFTEQAVGSFHSAYPAEGLAIRETVAEHMGLPASDSGVRRKVFDTALRMWHTSDSDGYEQISDNPVNAPIEYVRLFVRTYGQPEEGLFQKALEKRLEAIK